MNGWIRASSSPIWVTWWAEIGYVSATIWWCIDFSITWPTHRTYSNTSTWNSTKFMSIARIYWVYCNEIFWLFYLFLGMALCFDYCYFSALLHRLLYFELPIQIASMYFHPAIKLKQKSIRYILVYDKINNTKLKFRI